MAAGMWHDKRQSNLLDGGAPFVKVYETSDKRFIAVCAIERRFYKALLQALDISDIDPEDQYNTASWAEHEAIFGRIFKSRTRDEWSDLLEGTDACAVPVLSLTEAPGHPHNVARGTFVTKDDVLQPGPAPRFSRTLSEIRHGPAKAGGDFRQILTDWGLAEEDIPPYV